jgi:hypothetical protein
MPNIIRMNNISANKIPRERLIRLWFIAI